MKRLILPLTAALFLLDACAPATGTVTYTLPPTPGGRICAHQCLEAQDYCHQACDLKQRACVTDVQARAIGDYDNYTRAQFSDHRPIEFNPSDFERQAPCTEDRKSCASACDKHYQTCYSGCGGQVSVESSCRFLCF